MVVPHCLPLLVKFLCHINFEVANAIHLFQYLFKYVYKGQAISLFIFHALITNLGPDTTKVRFFCETDHSDAIDEIQEYWNAQYLSAGEAAWRIMGFHVASKEPAVTALPVHLPSSRPTRQFSRREGNESNLSLLDHYFLRPQTTFILDGIRRSFDNLTYADYYELFRLASYDGTKSNREDYFQELPNPNNSPRMHVIKRKDNNTHITRLPTLKPSNGDVFYLRTILQRFPSRSFLQARTIDGKLLPSFQEAANEHGLFLQRHESSLALLEATSSLRTPNQLRYLFVDLLINNCVPAPLLLWQEFAHDLTKDFHIRNHHDSRLASYLTLHEIQRLLQEHDESLATYGLPEPPGTNLESMTEIMQWSANSETLLQRARDTYQTFNEEQKEIFDTIWNANEKNEPLLQYIDSRARTGKTTIITTLCDAIRGSEKIILPMATSAFAAQLYPGGRTTHSTFKVLFPLCQPCPNPSIMTDFS